MKLLTNNPRFKDYKNSDLRIEVEFFDTTYLEILEKTRDYVHKQYEILTHPLYGSVKPNETLYRSVLIREAKQLDYNSVNLISDAISSFTKFQKNKITPEWTERVKDDFSVIDYDLITNAINRILN